MYKKVYVIILTGSLPHGLFPTTWWNHRPDFLTVQHLNTCAIVLGEKCVVRFALGLGIELRNTGVCARYKKMHKQRCGCPQATKFENL